MTAWLSGSICTADGNVAALLWRGANGHGGSMGEITVARWTRYGHDRLYVEEGGQRLGYWDNKAATAHLEAGADQAVFYAALAKHGVVPPQREANERVVEPPLPESPVGAVAPPAAQQPPPAATDLASHRPGEGPLQRALAERQAAPVKTFVARVLGVHTEERAWRIGGKGEKAVGERLARLGPEWRSLHSITVNETGTDIDHLVIGPGGVFTINAKHHPDSSIWVGGDTFLVDGQRTKYVPAARHEARRAEKTLSSAVGYPVSVTGVIAVMGATRGFKVKEQPRDHAVVVVARRDIDRWLLRHEAVLTPDQVNNLYEVARLSTTWLPSQ